MISTSVWRRLWIPLAAPLVFFADALGGRRLLASGDGYAHYLPLHVVAARAWRHWQLPSWNPFAFGGYPLLATGQVGAFYPPHAVFLVLNPVLANNFVVVASFVLAAAGAFLLARHLTGDDSAATVAGLAFGLCGFLFAHAQHQAIAASAAWLPWSLLGFERLRERFTAFRLLTASVGIALALLAGHGQMFAYTVAVLSLYATVLAVLERRFWPMVAAAAMLVAGVALGGIQLLPTAAILGATDRANLSYRDAVSYSLPLSHTVLFVFPELFGNYVRSGPYHSVYGGLWNLTELSAYPGLAAAVLAAAGLGRARKDRRAVALAVVAGAGLLVALGDATPLGHLVYSLPLYGRFRAWARYTVTVDLTVAVLAAYGVAVLRGGGAPARGPAPERERELRAAVRRAAVLAALVVVAAAIVTHLEPVRRYVTADTESRHAALVIPTTAAVLAAGCCWLTKGLPRAAVVLLTALVAADLLGSFGAFVDWRTESPSPVVSRRDLSPAAAPNWGQLDPDSGGITRYAYVGGPVGAPPQYVDVSDSKGLRSINGFDPLAPRDYLRATGNMGYFGTMNSPQVLWERGSHLLDLLRISAVLINTRPGTARPPAGSVLAGGRTVPGTTLVRVDYHPRLPSAFLVGGTARLPRAEILAADRGELASFDPASTALIERACSRCPGSAGPVGTAGPVGAVTAARWATSSVAVELTAARRAMLVVSQSWFPGWEATVDGHPEAVVRADGIVQGVPVGPGHHRVVLHYRPPGLVAGAAVSALTLVALGGWCLLDRRRGAGLRTP